MRILGMLIMLGTTVCYGQQKPCPSETKYDRFKDTTTEVCHVLTEQPNELSLFAINLNVKYPGRLRQPPGKVILLIVLQRGQVGGMLSPEFDLSNTLYFLSDSDRVEVTAVQH